MSSTGINHDIEATDEVDWLERQFFSQARLSQHDLEWGPAPVPTERRRAVQAALGMLAVALAGVITFLLYANLIIPAPAPSAADEPLLPPSAASSR